MPKIKGSQIRGESVTGDQIQDDTLTGDDIDESTLKITLISDLDGDTKIHVEESADEDKIRFYVAGSEEVTIDSNGRLGINTNDPNYKLDVSGNMGLNEYIYHNGDEDTYIRFQNNQLDLVAGGQIASFGSNILNIAGSIVPSSDVTYDLGSTSNVWNNVYANSISLGDLGSQNEILIVSDSNKSIGSSNLLAIDTANERVGIGTTSPSVKLDIVGESSGETQIRMAQHNTDADAPDIRLFKSRGTEASPTAVADNDNLAFVNSFAYDGSAYQQSGAFGWNADGTDGDSTFSIKTRVSGTTADRVTIDSSGNTIITGDLMPNADDTYDLGSSSIKWAELHVDDATIYNNLTLSGSDISFQDNDGTFPTDSGGFFWDLNNDEARIYAVQPSSDAINFYFKLSDNNGSSDRFIFWVDDYRGTSYDRYPLYMHGDNLYIHAPPSGTSGTPDLANAKINIPRSTSSGTTTTHKGRLFLDGDNTSDLYIRFQNNTENAYIFQDQSNSNTFKLESANSIAFNTGGANERMRISNDGSITVENDFTVNGEVISSNFKSTGDITINAVGGDIKFEDNGTRRLTIEDGGNIGVGSLVTNPSYLLHLKRNTTSPMLWIDNIATDDTDFIYAYSSLDVDPDSNSYLLRWVDNGSDTLYYVRGNGSGGSNVSTSFTAGHDTVIEVTDQLLPGMIVESTGEIWYKPTDITFETALPKCRLTTSAMSKKVYGVVGGSAITDENSKAVIELGGKIINGFLQSPAFTSYGRKGGVADNEVHLNTMSIGEGVVWVTNINGEIENGDLICSSDIMGHGQLQNDDIMRSMTVAKCTEDIPWDSVNETIELNGVYYKKYLTSCTFHCG